MVEEAGFIRRVIRVDASRILKNRAACFLHSVFSLPNANPTTAWNRQLSLHGWEKLKSERTHSNGDINTGATITTMELSSAGLSGFRSSLKLTVSLM